MRRKRTKQSVKIKIWEKDNYTCVYCGISLTIQNRTVDHVIPMSYGGSNTQDNMVSCCRDCNQKKAKKEYFKIY